MTEPKIWAEDDFKVRYGILHAALARNERTTFAYRQLLIDIQRHIITAMINEKNDVQQRILYDLLKMIEDRSSRIDVKPLHLKSKM